MTREAGERHEGFFEPELEAVTGRLGMSAVMPLPVDRMQYTLCGSDGVHLNLHSWGTATPRYFLIHGFADNGFSWNPLASSLCGSGGTVAIDLRGHGDSDPDPSGIYTGERLVEDVAFALRELDLRDVVLFGHSMGAAIAIHVAATCPDRVAGLVLVDGGPSMRRPSLARVRTEFENQPWSYDTVDDYCRFLEERLRLASASLLREVALNALRRNAQGRWELKCDRSIATLPTYIDDEALSEMLLRVTCPVLLARGTASVVLSRAAAERLVASVPDAILRSVPNAGHAVMLDNPEGLHEAVTPFLASLRRPAFRDYTSFRATALTMA